MQNSMDFLALLMSLSCIFPFLNEVIKSDYSNMQADALLWLFLATGIYVHVLYIFI